MKIKTFLLCILTSLTFISCGDSNKGPNPTAKQEYQKKEPQSPSPKEERKNQEREIDSIDNKMIIQGLKNIEAPLKNCSTMSSCEDENSLCFLNDKNDVFYGYHVCEHSLGNKGNELTWVPLRQVQGRFNYFRDGIKNGKSNLSQAKLSIKYKGTNYYIWLFVFNDFDHDFLINSGINKTSFEVSCSIWRQAKEGTFGEFYGPYVPDSIKLIKTTDDLLNIKNLCQTDNENGLKELQGRIYAEVSKEDPRKIFLFFKSTAISEPVQIFFVKFENKRIMKT